MIPANTANATQESPADDWSVVTPTDDTAVGAVRPRGLFVGTGGNVSVKRDAGATAVVFANVPDGSVLPVKPWSVQSTGTTASDIVALF